MPIFTLSAIIHLLAYITTQVKKQGETTTPTTKNLHHINTMQRNLGRISIVLLNQHNKYIKKTLDGLSNLCNPVADAKKRLKDAIYKEENEIVVCKNNLRDAIDNLGDSLFVLSSS